MCFCLSKKQISQKCPCLDGPQVALINMYILYKHTVFEYLFHTQSLSSTYIGLQVRMQTLSVHT